MSAHINDTSAGRCTAALTVKGESFRCDLATEHDGWAHSNQPAEAIWNDGEPPVTATDRPSVTPRADCGCDLSVGPNALHIVDDHDGAAARAETTDERVVHNHGPTDGPGLDCPETFLPDGGLRGACLNRAETTTATTEDAARAIAAWALDFAGLGVGIYLNGETIGDPHGPWDVPTDAADSLAAWLNARGLLATARTRPTREELAEAIMDSDTIPCDVCDDSRCHYCRSDALRKADAVLALLADQPTEAEAGARALEQAAEWLRSDMDEPWGDRAANRLDVRAARIRAGGA